MTKPTIKHVPGPAEKLPPKVDILGLQLTFANLLEGLAEEVWRSTPSHSWKNMKGLLSDIGKLRKELQAIVTAREIVTARDAASR